MPIVVYWAYLSNSSEAKPPASVQIQDDPIVPRPTLAMSLLCSSASIRMRSVWLADRTRLAERMCGHVWFMLSNANTRRLKVAPRWLCIMITAATAANSCY